MEFPVYIRLFGLSIHPHILFESLAYFLGFRIYLWTRPKTAMPRLTGLAVIAGAIAGAALGSKLLFWLEDIPLTVEMLRAHGPLWGGKTIVGGLLGGLLGVELAKKLAGWRSSTGDAFVYPLIAGMCIGRVGCFLTGLDDQTHGPPTTWITGVDFGDGILRHPAQLYEIAWLLLLAMALLPLYRRGRRQPGAVPAGRLFQLFMAGYLLFRFGIDFIKPTIHPYLGLNNIQLACLAGLAYYVWLLTRSRANGRPFAGSATNLD